MGIDSAATADREGVRLQDGIAGFDSPSNDRVVATDAVSDTALAPLLDSKAAAALLNVPASWVLAEARADRIPHVRLGRYVRFDAAELRNWWQGRRRGPWRSRGTAAEAAHSGAPPAPRNRQAA
jgi:excisionase family DNA binding protein